MSLDVYSLSTSPNKEQDAAQQFGDPSDVNLHRTGSTDPTIRLPNGISDLNQSREASESRAPKMTIDNRDDPRYSELHRPLGGILKREESSSEYSSAHEIPKGDRTIFSKCLSGAHNRTLPATAEKGWHDGPNGEANHKRALVRALTDLNNLEEHHLQPCERNTTSEHPLHDRFRVGEPKQGTRKQSRSHFPAARYADVTVEHEAEAMSGRSPGTRKRKQHSSSREPVGIQDHPDDPASPPTVADEVADSDVEFENEGEAVKSKRIRPDLGAKLKQHSSETDALNSAQDEPPAYAHRNACDPGESLESKDALKKPTVPWGPLARYRDPAASSLPDYRRPQDHAPVAVESPAAKNMRASISGPKPVNRLGDNNPPFAQTFDLYEEHTRPNKRQKTEWGSINGNGSYSNAIDLDPEQSNKRESFSAKSGHSHTQNGLFSNNESKSEGRVQEYNGLEKMMKGGCHSTRRKSGISSNSQVQKTRATHQPLWTDYPSSAVINHGEAVDVVDGEDASDPIYDCEVDPKGFKTTPQVIITTCNNSTALHKPARQKKSNSRGSRNDSTSPPNLTDQTSRYSRPNGSSRKRRNSSNSNSEAYFSPQQSKLRAATSQPNGTSSKKKSKISSNGRRESELSQDELSLETASPNRTTATNLLARRERTNNSSTTAKMKQQASMYSDSSDNESSLNRGQDMIPSLHFLKNEKLPKAPTCDRFKVIQIFSEAHKWLLHGSNQPWSLRQSLKNGDIAIFDHKDSAVRDLFLVPNSIRKIERSKDDGKLILLKSVDQTARGAPKIFLELGSREENEGFCANLKKSVSNIGIQIKDLKHMAKTFQHMQKPSESATKQAKKIFDQEPDDLQLIKKNAGAKNSSKFERALADKNPPRANRMSDRMMIDDGGADPEVRPNTGVRQTRSSGICDADTPEPLRQRKVSSITPVSFFGSRDVTTQTSNPHATRSSARISDKAPAPGQSPKQRSPSPERWTVQNPNWAVNWRSSIIYPQEGKDRATVDKQDILRLDEGEFLNDNLIIFYLRWLEHNLGEQSPDLAKRVYFHNTFFYERLTKQPTRGKRGINYEAVERWTAKVKLLSYDYIIVPVNENNHWYVAIICNAPKLLDPEPETYEDSQSQGQVHRAENDHSGMVSAIRSSPNSPSQPSVAGVSDAGVNETLEKMSLEDIANLAKEDNEWPEDEALSGIAPSKQVTSSADPVSVAASELKSAASVKKTKRRSHAPAPRKYNPKAPRIITLDSLGLKHSPTCTNLKEYLIAEVKSKHGVDIDIPGPLGMTAVHIPQQNNYCDCGLFLLNYIEQFLQRPDDFVECILQSREDLSIEWPKASETRIRIRELLFELQRDQVAGTEKLQQLKGKGKRIQKAESNRGVGVPAKSEFRDASSNARPLSELSFPEKKSVQLDPAEEEDAIWERPRKPALPENVGNEPPTEQPTMEPLRYGLVTMETTPQHQPLPEFVGSQEEPQASVQATQDILADRKDSNSSFFANFQNTVKQALYGHQKNTSRTEETRPGRSPSDALEILDSPPKAKVDHHDRFIESPSPSRRRVTPRTAVSHMRARSPPRLRERRPTPHPGKRDRSPSTEPEVGQNWDKAHQTPPLVDTDTIDSSPLEPAPNPELQFIDMTGDDSLKEDDDEMLLEHDNRLALALLSSPQISSPDESAQQKQPGLDPSKEGIAIASPNRRLRARQKVHDLHHDDPDPNEGRDASDRAIIGIGEWGQKHTYFDK